MVRNSTFSNPSLWLFLCLLAWTNHGFATNPDPAPSAAPEFSMLLPTGVNPLAPALGFNIFTENDAKLLAQHCEGPVAVGDDLSLTNSPVNLVYSVGGTSTGTFYDSGDAQPSALVVGDEIKWYSGTEFKILGNGYAKIGDCASFDQLNTDNNNASVNTRIVDNGAGYLSNPHVTMTVQQPAGTVCAPNVIDFAGAFTTMKGYADGLANCNNNVTLLDQNGNPVADPKNPPKSCKISLAANTTNVLNLDFDAFAYIDNLTFEGASPSSSAPLIINIEGDGNFEDWYPYNAAGIGGANGAFILFNFINIPDLDIYGSNAAIGTIFAPYTDVKWDNPNNIDGQVVAYKFNHFAGEVHYKPFDAIIDICGVTYDYDYGDLPAVYGSFGIAVDNGSPAYLGGAPDGDPSMQHSVDGLGDDNNGNDDEDGVTFAGDLVPGASNSVTVNWTTADYDSYISACIDYDCDGVFEIEEELIVNYKVGSSVGTATGSHTFNFTVPSNVCCGPVYARFWIHSDANIPATGFYTSDGEVEDYEVPVNCSAVTYDDDYGDAPSSYGDPSAEIVDGTSLGATVDGEDASQPSGSADGDDNNGLDDEDGVVFINSTASCTGTTGNTETVEVTVMQSEFNDMFINAWIDFNDDGDFDSNERIINNHTVNNSANLQTFSFDYSVPSDAKLGATYARFRLSNATISSATSYTSSGGEVEDYEYTVCGNSVPSNYSYTCVDGQKVYIYGDGIQGQTSSSLNIPNGNSADSILVVAVFKNGTAPSDVTFSNSNGQSVMAAAQTIANAPNGNTCSSCRVYKANLTGANTVSINTNGATNIHSFVAYVFQTEASGSTANYGLEVDEYFYQGDDTFVVPIGTEGSARNIVLTIPVSEMNNDTRVINITATAGSVSESVSYNTYDAGFGASLLFAEITLNNVPGSVSSVSVHIESPNSNGDSFVIGGWINVESDCGTTVSTEDFGDAPASYGDPSHEIVAGVSLGMSVDGDNDSQHSTNADGDDVDGNDDEDGVTFVGATASCYGTVGETEEVTITALQTVFNDVYINGWIDFNQDGDFDTNERIVTNHQVGNNASLQSFTFNYTVPADAVVGATYARFRFSNDAISSATDYQSNGGEVEDYEYIVCGTPTNGWSYPCANAGAAELIGTGMDNTTTASLTIKNSSTVDSVIVVAVSKGGIPPASVTFSTGGGASTVANAMNTTNAPNGNTCSSCRTYETTFYGNIDEVSINTGSGTNVQSFVAYVFRNTAAGQAASYGLELNEYFYQGDNTFVMPIATESSTRDLTIEIPVSEMTNDSRVANFTATAGGVTDTETINTYTLGNSLNIVSLFLEDVPGSASSVTITIESPNSNGDSYVIGGYLHVLSDCGHEFDFGDAPASYGDAKHEIKQGLTLGAAIDAEPSSNYSSDAEGDDNTLRGDEDGVYFLTMNGDCLGTAGTQQSLEIIVKQEAVFDAFVKAWIDFDGSGTFDEGTEVILENQVVYNQAGFQTILVNYTIPNDAVVGPTFVRVRYESNQMNSAVGVSSEGEVEDYRCLILGAVPVELVRFTGYKDDAAVQLEWETATEVDNKGFEVQRSQNGVDYQVIGWVDGRGTTLETVQYQFRDEEPKTGVNYYRLKQIDFDEAFEYSPVISVEFAEALPGTISVYPNPSTGLVNYRLPIDESANDMEIRISDMTGRVVLTVRQDFMPQGTIDLSALPAGMYTLDVITGQSQFTDLISKLK